MTEDLSSHSSSTSLTPASPTTPTTTTATPPDASAPTNSLDSLLSPANSDFDADTTQSSAQTVRESISESEFNEVALEDVRLSSASTLLSHGSAALNDDDDTTDTPGKQLSSPTLHSPPPLPEPPLSSSSRNDRRGSTSSMLLSSRSISGHKKSASVTTIRSLDNNAPFILARLDAHKEEDRNNRSSIDGQHKLQEEFARLQSEQNERDKNKASTANAIDWDFWGLVMADYEGFAATQSQALAQAIEKGIPDSLRGMMWQLMAAAKNTELEASYLKLLKETSPHEKAITRDLGRTFPHHDFFHDMEGIGQENLFNVLKAYSLYDTQVGYCQGLPFVVAILLLNMPDEEAFSMLVRLMYSYDLRGHFLPEMPRLQLRLFQFDRLIEELLPVLHVHFLRQGIKSSMFCSQWFLTLFSYRFPLSVVFRIYDNCLANGIEAIFSFSIVLLQKNEEKLLALKFDELLGFLNNELFEFYTTHGEDPKDVTYHVDRFVQDAAALRITPFMLDSYSREYDEFVRTRDAHAIEIDSLRNSNRSLLTQVKHLETSLASLNAEHVELLNELVKSRLRNEETEAELVRYKLLYAEAMHINQDAGAAVSHRTSSSSMFSLSASSLFGRKSS